MHKFIIRCSASVASAFTSGIASAISVRISILGGASAEKRFSPSVATTRRSIRASFASSSSRLNVRIFLTTSLARRAAAKHSLEIRARSARKRRILQYRVGKEDDGHQHIVDFVGDAAGERADRLQSLTMPQLPLQFLAPRLGLFLLLDLVLEPVIDADQLVTHALEIHRQVVELANAGADIEHPCVVARGDGAGHILQPMDRPRQTIAQDDGDADRHTQVARQQPQHAAEGEVNPILRRAIRRSRDAIRRCAPRERWAAR